MDNKTTPDLYIAKQKRYRKRRIPNNRVLVANGTLVSGQILLSNNAVSAAYSYDAVGNQVARRLVLNGSELIERRTYDLRGQQIYVFQPFAPGATPSTVVAQKNRYDVVGRLIEQIDYYGAGSTRAKTGGGTQDISGWIKHAETMSFDKDGRLLSQTSKGRIKNWTAGIPTGQSELTALTTLSTTGQHYDGLSRSSGYTWTYKEHDETYAGNASDAKNYTHTFAITYEAREGYLEKSNYGYSSNSNFKASTTTSQYDGWGRLISVRENTPKKGIDDRIRYMSLDGDGMILRRREGTYKNYAFSQTTEEKNKDAVYTYGSGNQLAEQTRDGTKLDVFGLMGLRDAGKASKDQQKFINKQAKSGNRMGAYDQFTQRYSVYGQDSATRVQVQSGDTLQGIAQRVYGNSSLWYVLAAANALSGDSDLVAGTSLKVPDTGVAKNDSSTFKPYNPNEIVGSTAPSLPYIPPASSNQCAMIAMIVVMVAATVFTAGAAAAGFGAGLQAIMSTGLSLVTGEFGIAAMAIYGGIGAFGGSIASQAVGKALGVVDHISLRQAVGTGLGAAITAGIAGGMGGTMSTLIQNGQWVKVAASAALSAAGSYAANKVAGVPNTSFSWKSIAASAVTSVVAGKINKSMGTVYNKISGSNDIIGQTIGGMVSGAVNLNVRRQFGFDDKVDYGSIAADAFGNALGNSIVGRAISGPAVNSAAKESSNWGLSPAELAEVMKDPNGRTALELLISMGQAGDGGALVSSKPNLSGIPIPESGVYSLPLGELTEKQMLAYESAKAQYTERPLGRNAEQISADAYDVARLVQITEQLDEFNKLIPAVSLKFPDIGKEWTKISEVMTSAIVAKDAYFSESIPGLLPRGVERITSSRDLNAIGLTSRMMVDEASGFYAAAYRNYGANNILIAFRGTEGAFSMKNPDWVNNIMQLTGNGAKSPQFQRAVLIGQQINKSDFNVSFTGHSLGGGLAATAAVVAQRSAITFNAEGVLRSTMPNITTAEWNNRNRLIQAINIKGEAVSAGQDSLKYVGAGAAAAFELKNPVAALALQQALNLKQPLSITLRNVPSAIGTRTEISANEAFMVRGPYDGGYGSPVSVGIPNMEAAHGQSQMLYALTAQYKLAAMNTSFAGLMSVSVPKH